MISSSAFTPAIVPVAKIKSVLNKKVRLTAIELPVVDSYSELDEKARDN